MEGSKMAGKYRELVVYASDTSALYRVKFVGGGELPDVLKSSYTSQTLANAAIALYYESKVVKKKAVA